MSRLVVVGSSGFLGKGIIQFCQGQSVPTLAMNRSPSGGEMKFDLNDCTCNTGNIQKGDCVIFLAGISSPDICEKDKGLATKINYLNTKESINRIMDLGARVIFISSDIVYGDAGNDIVDEYARVNPASIYGELKAKVEEKFKTSSLFKSFRLSYMFDGSDKFSLYLKEMIEQKKPIEVFDGFKRSIAHCEDLYLAVLMLMEKWSDFDSPYINICGEECLSREQFVNGFLVGTDVKAVVSEAPEGFWRSRPKAIHMNSLFLEDLLERKPTNIIERIKQDAGRN